jgi:tryptophan synthase alpha chain
MNRIDKKFKELKRLRKKAFIAYITAGDPDLSTTKRIALALEKSGVDIIELGIPFSDPLADGPTIQAASQRALAGGASLKRIFSMTRTLRKNTDIPLVYMTYYNPVLKYGIDNFVNSCKACGVDGVIIPDLPYEEAVSLIRLSRKKNVATIFLAAPTSTRERIREIARSSSGFIYYVSLTGVTGARRKLSAEITKNVRTIKSITDTPIAVGFGISTPAQAKEVAAQADGVIIGSAIVRVIERCQKNEKAVIKNVSRLSESLARAIHGK